MVSLKSLMAISSAYVLGFLITAGHFYRRHGLRMGVRQAACVLFWPAWLFLEYSIKDIFDSIADATMGTDNRAAVSFGIGLFSAGQFLSSNWETCSGVACTGVILKSSAMIFPPVGATYLTWLVWQLA
ncbi:hypothetical protein ABIF07_001082 [Bradyrhizobium elkanii]|uniref:hypothetical protein n=1 Tax=Bradyrhizobium elkanii TaxID=29448 RepID=UPI00216A5728|nr:hypothetical protein [Bradyrhizobium elkanii]MCS3692002.1 hypothetical protein [Bradyrhizobium elkanii]